VWLEGCFLKLSRKNSERPAEPVWDEVLDSTNPPNHFIVARLIINSNLQNNPKINFFMAGMASKKDPTQLSPATKK
jgi:hypothetical protein